MGLKRSILLITAAFFATSIVEVSAAVPDAELIVENSGCVTYIDHGIVDVEFWACAYPYKGLIGIESDHYKITVFTGFQGGDNPPKMSKPEYMQTFEWKDNRGDVSVSEEGCLHTVAKSGKPAQQIGSCPSSKYTGAVMSNPYYSRTEFDRESSDSGVLPFEIASTNIASSNIASTEINSAETAETAPDNPAFLPTTMAFNQPLPLAGFAFPGSSSSGSLDGPELVDFNTVQRSRKRRRHI